MGACTPERMARCPLKRCYTDQHHLYYPRRDYTEPIDQAFRNLGENIVELCRWEHIETHETTQPPRKPSLETMIGAVLGSGTNISRRVQAALDAQQVERYWNERARG